MTRMIFGAFLENRYRRFRMPGCLYRSIKYRIIPIILPSSGHKFNQFRHQQLNEHQLKKEIYDAFQLNPSNLREIRKIYVDAFYSDKKIITSGYKRGFEAAWLLGDRYGNFT